MNTNYIYAIASVLIVSSVSFVGIFTLSLSQRIIKKTVFLFVALAVGALLGDAFLHLIPEAFSLFPDPALAGLLIIIGILIFFTFEKLLHWHHHHEEENEPALHHGETPVTKDAQPSAAGHIILLSDGLHNLLDGLIIGASYLMSIELGIATTIAVVLHEIPQEIGDFGVLLYSGYTRTRALFLNFISGLAAVGGAFIALLLGSASTEIINWLIPIAAGGFIYVAAADLMPELHKTRSIITTLLQLAAIAIGIIAMILLLLSEI